MLLPPPRHRLLRQAVWLLVGFCLSLAAAVASPWVNPKNITLICSAAHGMHLVVLTDDGVADLGQDGLDCPLCANLAAPPPVWQPPQLPAAAPQAQPQSLAWGHAPLRPPAAWLARAPPLPRRV